MTDLRNALVIDDDPIQRELVAIHLRRKGVPQILMTADGGEAKSLVATHGAALDVILSDLNMPEFDGVEFLTFLASQRLGAALIFITGASPTVTRAADKLASVSAVNFLGTLQKPIDFAALDRLLDAVPARKP